MFNWHGYIVWFAGPSDRDVAPSLWQHLYLRSKYSVLPSSPVNKQNNTSKTDYLIDSSIISPSLTDVSVQPTKSCSLHMSSMSDCWTSRWLRSHWKHAKTERSIIKEHSAYYIPHFKHSSNAAILYSKKHLFMNIFISTKVSHLDKKRVEYQSFPFYHN